MAFDQPTRNRLARFVGDSRALLTAEFTRQLQHDYGLDPASGDITDLARLSHLDDARRETARLLRETLAHYLAGQPKPTAKARRESLERIVREQAFTVLNRLCALRMMEARGLLLESVGRGYQSKGFQLYGRLAGPALGETGDAYRSYLFSMFDEFAVDLPVLFDRFSPQGRLFPRPTVLLQLLDEINHPDIDPLWAEDETIGWIYQYFNSVEERRQMRAESQAPRNSRELAVRNQFFTPRYVVEFLTDNTLGTLWYEMTQGHTALKESCRYLVRRPTEIFLTKGESPPAQTEGGGEGDLGGEGLSEEELLKYPIYIPYREIKDPRDLKMLDPACGSMHFGLYAFDLFEQIYAEAWALEAERAPHTLTRPAGLKSLRQTYPDEAAFRRDIPRLIIEHNIHGIDIDPRAVQIAGLSLWLRAQKSWHSQGVKAADRLEIRKSNIVTAEPMPGDAALLDEFITRHLIRTPEEKLLGQLLRRVFEAMKLAGEAGSLLKIEEEIAADIAEAKAKWYAKPEPKQASFLEEAARPEQVELGLDVSGISDAAFWDKVEGQIYSALQLYAKQAENGHSYRRRLFANDAARGFAFIDLCRQRYDVVLMNPPFGEPSTGSLTYLRKHFPLASDNLLIAFIVRFYNLMTSLGRLAAITDRSFINKRAYERFRIDFLIAQTTLDAFVDLGWNVLDNANVEVAAHVHSRSLRETNFLNVSQAEDKAQQLLEFIKKTSSIRPHKLSSFLAFPGSALVYNLAPPLVATFESGVPIEENLFKSYGGLKAGNADHLFRLVWEVAQEQISPSSTWALFQNGSPFSPYYYGCNLVVRCDQSTWKTVQLYSSSRITNSDLYFTPGISYGKRTDLMYGYKIRANQVPSMEGHLVLPTSAKHFWKALLVINSAPYQEIINHLCGQHKYAGYINPAKIELDRFSDLSEEIRQVTTELESLDTGNETSIIFIYPKCLSYPNRTLNLKDNLTFVKQWRANIVSKANSFRTEYNKIVCKNLGWVPNDNVFAKTVDYVQLFFDEVNSISLEAINLLSYILGCCFGRWDLRIPLETPELALGHDDFAYELICPPGMLVTSNGQPARPNNIASAAWLYARANAVTLPPLDLIDNDPSVSDASYPVRISWPGILVDDPGHPEDIESRVRDALRVIWPDNADAIEQEACQILDVPSLRAYFANPNNFFDDHLKRYSKSRRVAPIYWPLSTPSGSYTLWLYYHRLDNQILYTCVNDFVDPKLKDVSDQASVLRQKAKRSQSEEDDLADLSELEVELHDFRAELLRLADIWRPNLNDGGQITAAPLWRLFQHRGWQNRLKATWDKLAAGDYDWAHVAMSIWPERVVPKCVEDRSLAVAHDLEDLFWVEDEGSWRRLQEVEQEIAGQIKRRQKAAHTRLSQHLADLAAGAGRGMPAYQVWQHLSEGDWDDTPVALALWPERVAEKCWDQPFLAAQLGLKLPNKRTKAHRERFLKKLLADSAADLADAAAAVFQDESDAFEAVRQALAAGERDEQPLALALWPERVVDKCADNLELAAQHHLRRYFWVQPPGGSPWRRRNPQAQEIRDEIARRKGG